MDNRKLAIGLANFTPAAREDMARRADDLERGKTVELLRRASKEMYDNPVVNAAISFTPGAGDVQSGYQAWKSANEGDWYGAGLNAVGVLPFIPALAGMVKKTKQTVSIPAADDFFMAIGKERQKVMADVDKLHRKHPDKFASPDDVESHLNYVFGAPPDHVIDASDKRFSIVARNSDEMPVETGEPYRAAITDFTGEKNGNYWVRSAYPMSQKQIDVKLASGRFAVPDSGVTPLDASAAHLPGAKQAHALASISPESNVALEGMFGKNFPVKKGEK